MEGDGDNSGKSNMDNQITKNKIVTEDIKISHTQTSKVMKKKDRRKQRKEKLLESELNVHLYPSYILNYKSSKKFLGLRDGLF